MIKTDLSDLYRDYIACLNKQDWPKLGQFVHDEVIHNGRRVGLSGYLEMLESDFDEIPDLYFNIRMLISDPPYSKPAGLRLYAKGNVPRPPCKREESFVYRECDL